MGAVVNSARNGVRAARAAQTRRRMVTAAYDLFSEQGYDSTPMTAIANRAAVAVQTLYFTFGTKRQLLQEAFALAVLGPTDTPPHLQPWFARMQRARTARAGLAAAVDGAVAIFQRVSPLITAVRAVTTADPDVRDVWAHQEQLRRQGYHAIVALLSERQKLRPGITLEKATDTMLVLLGPDVYRSHTQDNGWTPSEYTTWATDALYQILFVD